MACIQDCNVVGDVGGILRDVKNSGTPPPTLGNHLKKMTDRDVYRVFGEGVEETLG
jgi:hypothetical protein